ncbi:hypothetical protein [Marilutibacter aestuarii]|uniref:Sulfotransferase n=1 Tax=Marilutibacter aestuarii TaxID=1706195 RepID=A0A508AFP8_9GAMM|nr:hypothetical protein [Lysobacter aestuarii]TQD48890.1 hypothetical protein FKV25_04505 [Lysobacter aestuarii]
MKTELPPAADDPRHFPVSYDIAADAFCFAPIDASTLLAPFLDARMGDAWTRKTAGPTPVPGASPGPAPAWLFHSAFCCSTLLARALHAPDAVVALKEPHALTDLATLSLAPDAGARARLEARTGDACRLLARAWAPGGRVLVKPTNAVNRLIPRLLRAAPGSRGVLLHGSLEDFLYSCLKKLPGAEEPLRWMVRYLLPGTQLQQALGVDPTHPFNPVESSVLVWHAQMERYAGALAADAEDRLRSLDMAQLLDDPRATVAAVARWLCLDGVFADGEAAFAARVDAVFTRNSKDVGLRYGPDARAIEREALRERLGPIVASALEWSSRAVAPHTRMPRERKALAPG